VVQKQAEYFGLRSLLIRTGADGKEFPSNWMLLSYNGKFFERPEIAARVEQDVYVQNNSIRIWTDDFSNLFQILK
jgi:hypothetical protein